MRQRRRWAQGALQIIRRRDVKIRRPAKKER
jgi:cellulose synthase/poly-beta-1,6-N-acetylglucosamine synthase-like glycosyltransferase